MCALAPTDIQLDSKVVPSSEHECDPVEYFLEDDLKDIKSSLSEPIKEEKKHSLEYVISPVLSTLQDRRPSSGGILRPTSASNRQNSALQRPGSASFRPDSASPPTVDKRTQPAERRKTFELLQTIESHRKKSENTDSDSPGGGSNRSIVDIEGGEVNKYSLSNADDGESDDKVLFSAEIKQKPTSMYFP